MINEPIKFQSTLSEKSQRSKLLFFGETMKHGSLNCQRCNTTRTTRLCSKCGYDAVMIRIAWKGKTYRFWNDSTDRPYSLSEGAKTLHTINQQINAHSFNPQDYLTSTIKEMRFRASYERWIKVKEKEAEEKRFSFETLRLYRSYYRNHFKPIYDLDIREIALKDLQELLDNLPGSLSLNYKRRLFQCLSSFFHWLIRWGTLKEFPVFPEIVGDDAQIRKAISYNKQIEAINRLPEIHRDIFWFMRETGTRIGEACVVQVKDLDIVPDRVMIQRTVSGSRIVETTKQKKKQTVPLSQRAKVVVNRNKQDKLPGAFLFLNPTTHRYYSPEFLRKLWKKHSGIEITLYEAMRHSTISDWAQNAGAYDVQMLARHTDQRTTQKYVHEVDDRLLKIVDKNDV